MGAELRTGPHDLGADVPAERTDDLFATEAGERALQRVAARVQTEMGLRPILEEITSSYKRLDDVTAAVALLAPAEVAEAAGRLLATTAKVLTGPPEAREAAYQGWRVAHRQFCDLARADLGVKGRSLEMPM